MCSTRALHTPTLNNYNHLGVFKSALLNNMCDSDFRDFSSLTKTLEKNCLDSLSSVSLHVSFFIAVLSDSSDPSLSESELFSVLPLH